MNSRALTVPRENARLYREYSAERFSEGLNDRDNNEHHSDEEKRDQGVESPFEIRSAEGEVSEKFHNGTQCSRYDKSSAVNVEISSL